MTMEIESPQSSGNGPFVKRVALFLAVVLMGSFGLALFVPGPVQKNAYMGAEYCGSCHQEEYKSWSNSPHQKAHDSLPADQKNNPACLSCHATGVLEANQPFLPGVQCESCHGPGQYYANLHIKKDPVLSKLFFMQKPTEESCLHCHSNAANLWSPHNAMKSIDHWSKGSKAFHGSSSKTQ